MGTCNLQLAVCGSTRFGKSSRFIASLEEIFVEIFIILVEEIERDLEKVFRKDLARKFDYFDECSDVKLLGLWPDCRIDEMLCVEKERRYASVKLTLSEQIESIEKISFSRLHILFQNNIVNPVDTLKSFVCDNISAFKNMHAEGQVRSLIPLKKGITLKLIEKEKQLHRPYLLFLCKKRILRSSVKKKQIGNCKSNSTLKNLFYKWTSVFEYLVIMQRQEDSRIFV